ncbi:MAG: 5'-methylthioadenosine/S-adenosylhomocysteine nucleosidase [Verrucomicrobia subdivision 3 bacterium]|nr:5'-methylthioadenosine/S-adenosylhomocysteine nucleosidase [Limisphaerales bacterium]MCS1414411.1 5'-methylthioadenosine/S-adenosylhomocysteine nucleosidase [Limisphaerales bacterium]
MIIGKPIAPSPALPSSATKPLPMPPTRNAILICFAVKAESQYLRKLRPALSLLHTGIGKQNAEATLQSYLNRSQPELVVTSGFAGGLHPELKSSEVLFDRTGTHDIFDRLTRLPFKEGTFHCSTRIATTAEEKEALWRITRCDAIDMESVHIHRTTQAHQIPCLTLRAISDTAHENLPLDFNALMTPQMTINHLKLFGALCREPTKIPELIRFNRSITKTAQTLATAISQLIED